MEQKILYKQLWAFIHLKVVMLPVASMEKGNPLALKVLKTNENYFDIFWQLGQDLSASKEVAKGLEEFACAMYGDASQTYVNELR